jgi:phage shock protein PspC (stress-responsive transcriptional regulator)
MNKTININLGGYFFHIDESAYQKLRRYLDAIARSLSEDPQGKNEIIADIEARISELLSEKITDARQVVNEQDISDIIKIMGEPEDYADGEETYTDSKYQYTRRSSNSKKLFRDGDDKFIGGVASGIGHYFDIDVIWIRLAFILTTVFTGGVGLIVYVLLWVLLPEARTTAEKLQMEGEAVNINNIEKKIREEFTNVKENIKKGAENVSEKFSNAEKKYKPKAKSGFQEFLDTLGNILTVFFKIIGKFIGVLIIIVSASVLISFVLALFSI